MEAVFQLLDEAENSSDEVTALIRCQKYEEAFLTSMETMGLFLKAITLCNENDAVDFKIKIRERVKLHSALCEDLRRKAYPDYPKVHSSEGQSEDSSTVELHAKEKDYKLLLNSLRKRVIISAGGDGLSNVIGLNHLKKLLKTSLIMYNCEEWGTELRRRGLCVDRRHFLLFGAPGTGKSLIIKSFHQEAVGTRMLELSMTDVMSRYIGDGEAMLKAAFEVAEQNAPCILFLDEIDGAFGVGEKRDLNASIINQFLTLSENCNGVQIFAATNKPWVLEPSFRRRFQFLVHVPLPDFQERSQVLGHTLKKLGLKISPAHLAHMAKATLGLSSSDLHKLVIEALEETWRPVQEATAFKEIEVGGQIVWTPCESTYKHAKKMSFLDLTPDKVELPEFSIIHLERAFSRIKRTTDGMSGGNGHLGKIINFALKHAMCARSGIPKMTEEYKEPITWQPPLRYPYPKDPRTVTTAPCLLDSIAVQTDISILQKEEPKRARQWPYDVLTYVYLCCMHEYD